MPVPDDGTEDGRLIRPLIRSIEAKPQYWNVLVRIAAVAVVLAAAAAAATELALSSSGAQKGTIHEGSFYAPALAGPLRFAVYLPPGYATSGRRYPVVYYLHGLPATGSAYRAFGFVPATLERLALRAIVVAPQGARDGDSDPEYLDWRPGRNWETAIAEELPAYVDTHFRTIRNRRGRALVGISAGGYGAFLLALHHLASFGVVESWSGYFHPTDPTGTRPLERGSPEADAFANAHTLVSDLRAHIRRYPTLIGFYVGRSDDRFLAENIRLDRELTAARVPHVFRVYPGGHSQQLWQTRAPTWLGLAMRHLERPTG
jgi:S-formylglutathione hydrolase FrmB